MASDNQGARSEIRKALVVDDDEVARNLIANHFGRIGGVEVTLLEDGASAWDAIQKERFDFIVLDWKLPKLSGLALFNRIRRRKDYRTTPLLVVSGFLEKNDFRLLQEFPCTGLMEKPFTMVLFQNRIEELMKESVWYGQNVALVDTILDAVKHDGKKAEQLLKQVLKKAPNPVPLAIVASRRMLKSGMLKSAQAVLESVLKADDGCVMAMNELGKALHLQGKHKQALEVLRRASKLSPQNLARLCLMGEVELNLKDPEAARSYFEKALTIDGEDHKSQSGLTVATNLQELLEAPEPMAVPQTFASLLNTMGITFVRNGQFEKGIEQYQAAMAFLHARDDSARVAFNLGLGFLRWGRPSEALPWFQKSERLAPEGFGKSAGYVRQLLMSGVGVDTQAEGAEGAAFAQANDPKKKGPQFGRLEDGKKKKDVVDDDASEGVESDGGKVIPFPGSGSGKPADDDIMEEQVGTTVVLSPGGSGRILDTEDFPEDGNLDGDLEDEGIAV